jgi:hypothetical protein
MPDRAGTCPLSQRELLELDFMEQRNNLLDLAAFLDRLDRSVDRDAEDDFRLEAIRACLGILAAGAGKRVESVHAVLSDPSTDLLPELDQKAAKGAYDAASGRRS